LAQAQTLIPPTPSQGTSKPPVPQSLMFFFQSRHLASVYGPNFTYRTYTHVKLKLTQKNSLVHTSWS